MPNLRKPILWILLLGMLGFSACRTKKSPEPLKPAAPVAAALMPAPAPAVEVDPEPPAVEPPQAPAIVQPLKVASILSHNMVLQQGTIVPVWGWASDGETVTVSFRDQKVSARTRNGKWMVKLRDLKPGGPDVLTVSVNSSSQIQFTNVLVGEVWVCSGQSNMAWPLSKAFEPQADITNSANPMIRLFSVPNVKADVPLQNLTPAGTDGSWHEANPQTVPSFSAVAYYFGRALHKARGVPIGLIQSSWGGSPAEAWTALPVLEGNPRYAKEIVERYVTNHAAYIKTLVEFEKEKDQLIKARSTKKTLPAAGSMETVGIVQWHDRAADSLCDSRSDLVPG